MRWPSSILRIGRLAIWALALVVACAVSAFGETRVLKQGEPAPYDGVIFDREAARQVVEDLRDKQSFQSKNETLQSEAATLQQQVDGLTSAAADKDRALELAEQREKLRDEIETKMKNALEMGERANALAAQAAEVSIKAAQASTAALEKMQGKLDRANSRTFWGTIGGFLAALVAAFAL